VAVELRSSARRGKGEIGSDNTGAISRVSTVFSVFTIGGEVGEDFTPPTSWSRRIKDNGTTAMFLNLQLDRFETHRRR
jgi:hypothetical protein